MSPCIAHPCSQARCWSAYVRAGKCHDLLLGCTNYEWTFMHDGRLTNISTLLWSEAVIVFLIGLVSEQITALTYRRDA